MSELPVSSAPGSRSVARVLESSLSLLQRARAGDCDALDELVSRYRPRLRRWARGRLPGWARDLSDTDDVVQEALVKTLRNLPEFVANGEQGFQSYLRTAVTNRIYDEVKRHRRRPETAGLDPTLRSEAPSPLEQAIGRQRLDWYEAALRRLAPDEREAVIARLEFGFKHVELAAALGKDTPDAARKLCRKALERLLAFIEQEPKASPPPETR